MFRLKSVYIKDYKNIQDQTFDFSSNTGYIALIGLNGSGKSNLLEAINIIFNELLDIPHTENVNGYSITFQLNDIEYTHTTVDDTEEHNLIPLNAVNKENLPSSVIACYSGEDLRLWHIAYEEYYMQYFKNAIRDRSFAPKIIYINKYCWKIAFISLLCSAKDSVKEFLKNVFSIDDIRSVDIHLEADAEQRDKFADHTACRWYDSIKHLQDEDENQLINANTLATTDMMMYGAPNSSAPDYVFQFLYLLSLPKKDLKKKQTVDKLINNIKININGISFDNLSEGEKKLILIETITQILGDENSLVLLDEPDAHTHIARKKDLLETITLFNGQTLLTTHAPVFVNEIYKQHKNNLFFIKNGALVKADYINQLITLSSGEIDFLNGTIVLSTKNILVTEGPYDKRYIEKAIEILCKQDKKYNVLHQIAIIPSNSAGNADTFYEQVLMPQIDRYNKIVFIFDYDDGGYSGWKKIKSKKESKLEALFYQLDYSDVLDTSNTPSKSNYILIEDFFASKSYKKKVEEVHLELKKTHKDFRMFTTNLPSAIKTYIERHYDSFDSDDYENFKSILDKLISVFSL